VRTLVYKRTHPGDPDVLGRFGIYDCMGQVRTWDFQAVIGVGGLGSEASSHDIDGKINWIGIGARKHVRPSGRGPLVTFDRFVLYEEAGPSFLRLAPTLARRMYRDNVRALLAKTSAQEKREIERILALAAKAPASSRPPRQTKSDRTTHRSGHGCRCSACVGKAARRRSCGC
jgi:hypothetical protein